MAGGQVISSQASKIQRRLSPYLPVFSIRRYSEGSKTDQTKKGKLIEEERAHSTAEVFRKVAEEKTKTGRRGSVLVEENSSADSKSQTVKEPPGNIVNSGS